jgi:hypothetical protein
VITTTNTAVTVTSPPQATTAVQATTTATTAATSQISTTPEAETAASPTETTSSANPPIEILGDVNGNGIIDIGDAVEILRYLAGMTNAIENNPQAFQAALVVSPREGRLPNISDVVEILRYLAGMSSAITTQ